MLGKPALRGNLSGFLKMFVHFLQIITIFFDLFLLYSSLYFVENLFSPNICLTHQAHREQAASRLLANAAGRRLLNSIFILQIVLTSSILWQFKKKLSSTRLYSFHGSHLPSSKISNIVLDYWSRPTYVRKQALLISSYLIFSPGGQRGWFAAGLIKPKANCILAELGKNNWRCQTIRLMPQPHFFTVLYQLWIYSCFVFIQHNI